MGGIRPKKTLGGENSKSLLCIVPAELGATSNNGIEDSLAIELRIWWASERVSPSSNQQSTWVEWAAFDQKRH
jgi:hypothetical protein